MKKPLLFIAWLVPQKRHGQSVTLIPRPFHMAIGGARREREHGQRPHHETKSLRMWIRSPITLQSDCVLSIVLRLTSDRTNLLQYLVMAQVSLRIPLPPRWHWTNSGCLCSKKRPTPGFGSPYAARRVK